MFIGFIANSSPLVLIIMVVLLLMSIYVMYKSIISYQEIIERTVEISKFKDNFSNGLISFNLDKENYNKYPSIKDLIVVNYKKLSSKGGEKIKSINEKKINYYSEEFERKFSSIATVASIAPYLGLLGTVIGIMNTFFSISESGSVSLAYIAPSIGESLVVTAIGLFVAIPANIIFNHLTIKTEGVFSFYNTINEEMCVANTD